MSAQGQQETFSVFALRVRFREHSGHRIFVAEWQARGQVLHCHIGYPFARPRVAVDAPACGAVVARPFRGRVGRAIGGQFVEYVAIGVNARPDPSRV